MVEEVSIVRPSVRLCRRTVPLLDLLNLRPIVSATSRHRSPSILPPLLHFPPSPERLRPTTRRVVLPVVRKERKGSRTARRRLLLNPGSRTVGLNLRNIPSCKVRRNVSFSDHPRKTAVRGTSEGGKLTDE